MASELSQMLTEYTSYETNFDGDAWTQWTGEHTEIPVYCLTVYLAITFQGPPMLAKGEAYPIRSQFALWNLLLAVFSIMGTYKTMPVLIGAVREKGFTYTTCTPPSEWYLKGPSGLWTTLFVYSKIPELLDTVFLVLQKKPVIFLHWFHHATVLLYCWHSFVVRSATGIWFISMNYFVHSVMYSYYFLAISGQKWLAKLIAKQITSLQLLQMFIGCAVTIHSAMEHSEGGEDACFVDAANYKMGLGMYFSYLVLFGILFYDKYVKKPRDAKQEVKSKDGEVCGVDVSQVKDSAGMFRSTENGTNDKKTN
eukprot:CAMPEP_0182915222 /NCGR_PEP_ID=MMETSP0105_2-20130417/182_1 /TAXON_ID=81532 ORGANISM="Acanthoeca-like sp., Strain 10tr" /NCGR_SAMPLE_ID=MMETSP0105_2 /ASSEMBLY_ACC=CAM_ASM_000205 /LENGTH=308 /DNA_ID=CAMNT_0025052061 /DNA_START=54 /DNA_END=980 /DNA_ORIENTATION=-